MSRTSWRAVNNRCELEKTMVAFYSPYCFSVPTYQWNRPNGNPVTPPSFPSPPWHNAEQMHYSFSVLRSKVIIDLSPHNSGHLLWCDLALTVMLLWTCPQRPWRENNEFAFYRYKMSKCLKSLTLTSTILGLIKTVADKRTNSLDLSYFLLNLIPILIFPFPHFPMLFCFPAWSLSFPKCHSSGISCILSLLSFVL